MAEPNVGAHMSMAGGMHLALERGAEVGCVSIAVFAKPTGRWKAAPLSEEEISLFRRRRRELGIRNVVAHASYLVNLASPDAALLEKSRAGLREELERCEALGIESLVFHPGAHMGAGRDAGIATLAASLDRIHAECAGFRSRTLLEITAGSGTLLGGRFEDLADVLARLRDPRRAGVCLDTCHLFAAGYDISTPAGWRAVTGELDDRVGLRQVRAWHVNDSKGALGSRRDRHEHIGRGEIGREGFRCLMRDRRFEEAPKILETPKEGNMDRRNLALLRRLAR